MTYGAKTLVQPEARPQIPYGLFSVLSFRDSGDGRWQNGVEWEPLACGPASGIGEPDCDPDDPQGPTEAVGLPKGDAEKSDNGEATPFTVYFKEKCSPVGRVRVAQDRATSSLLSREQTAVEEAVWTGNLDNDPNFQVTETSFGTSTPGAVAAEAIKAARRASGGGVVLHVGLTGAAALFAADVLVIRGERVFTVWGDPVVIGTGYAENAGGSTLGPAAAGHVWIVVTPALFGYRSEIFTSSERVGDLLDRGHNDMFGVAERTYLIGWDPCGVVAAQIAAEWEDPA